MNEARPNARVVIASKDAISDLISTAESDNPTLKNPKYKQEWQTIQLQLLTPDEMQHLFGLFPNPIPTLLAARKANKGMNPPRNFTPIAFSGSAQHLWQELGEVTDDESTLTNVSMPSFDATTQNSRKTRSIQTSGNALGASYIEREADRAL